MLTNSAPVAVSQKLTELSVGKATSRTPSCNGTEVHQSNDERHRHEKDHDRAVRREDLVVVLWRQVSLRIADRNRLLRAHHDRIGKTTQQHHQAESHVHDADALVIDACQPLAPQIRPPAFHGDGHEDGQNYDADYRSAAQREWFVEWYCRPAQLSQHVNLPPGAAADTNPHRDPLFREPPPSGR
jgi:hypothetical protein